MRKHQLKKVNALAGASTEDAHKARSVSHPAGHDSEAEEAEANDASTAASQATEEVKKIEAEVKARMETAEANPTAKTSKAKAGSANAPKAAASKAKARKADASEADAFWPDASDFPKAGVSKPATERSSKPGHSVLEENGNGAADSNDKTAGGGLKDGSLLHKILLLLLAFF